MEDVFFILWAALAAALIPYSTLSHAAETRPGCGGKIAQPYYTARFQWQGEKELVIGLARGENTAPTLTAQIWSGKACEAVCAPQSLERDDSARPVALTLECRSAGFTPAVTPATLFWASRSGQGPSLRFGTWLNGYQQTPVRVERDAYSKAGVAQEIAQN